MFGCDLVQLGCMHVLIIPMVIPNNYVLNKVLDQRWPNNYIARKNTRKILDWDQWARYLFWIETTFISRHGLRGSTQRDGQI